MPSIQLSEKETLARFGVLKAISNFPSNLTEQEEKNVKTVLAYMEIAYSPTDNKGAISVAKFCAKGNTFAAPSTFPNAHTAEEYSEDHMHVMSSLTDLHIIQFDVVVAKENFVSLRYTATGSHIGAPHNGIAPTGRKAQWTAAGNFVVDEESGLIKHWWKDWDKMRMWKQLGWVRPNNDTVEFA
ncbi:NTF2-like domain superfamily protein [Abortiporus biennis]